MAKLETIKEIPKQELIKALERAIEEETLAIIELSFLDGSRGILTKVNDETFNLVMLG